MVQTPGTHDMCYLQILDTIEFRIASFFFCIGRIKQDASQAVHCGHARTKHSLPVATGNTYSFEACLQVAKPSQQSFWVALDCLDALAASCAAQMDTPALNPPACISQVDKLALYAARLCIVS